MSEPSSNSVKRSSSSLIDVRLKKLQELVEEGIQPYTSGFTPDLNSLELKSKYGHISESEEVSDVVRLAGRLMAVRIMGKASFMRVHDVAGDFQIYLGRDLLGADQYNRCKKLDIG
ncbi:MAG: lysine--tRNA ligase, partial [Desulfomonilaceae bacterium]